MKSFITGITGFAGPYLAQHLLARGDQVSGSSLSGEWPQDLSLAMSSKVPLVCWDIATGITASARDQIIEFAPDVLYHLAAISIPDDCGRETPTPDAIAINVEGTRAVLDLATSLPSRPRVVFTSTAHVYAPVTFEQPLVNERSPVAPHSGYGISKRLAESLVLQYVADQRIDAVIARVFKHSGRRQTARLMLPQWAEQFAKRTTEPLQVYSLNSFLDLSDVRDVAQAYRLLATAGTNGAIYNVGSGINRRTGEIFQMMQRLAGDTRSIVETRPSRRQEAIADITKITADTGWKPLTPVEETVREVYEDWQARR